MADKKAVDFPLETTIAGTALLPYIDVDDQTDDPTGSDKIIAKSDFDKGLGNVIPIYSADDWPDPSDGPDIGKINLVANTRYNIEVASLVTGFRCISG